MRNIFVLLACLGSLSLSIAMSADPSVPVGAGSEADTNEAKPAPRIIVEAALPEGFPAPGPAGEVLRKSYPVYRAASTSKPSAFSRLFNHIQKHDIPMTAPVEMTLRPGHGNGGDREPASTVDMKFMYASTDVGTLGPDDDVQVIDLPALEVLSYGFFGPMDDAHLSHAYLKIDQQLAADESLESAGPARVMGYNSPFVPAMLRYTEVQVPVREKTKDEARGEMRD